MRKEIFIFLALILLSFVSADRVLTNTAGIDFSSNIYGGSNFLANFSYDYLNTGENIDNSPLIIQLNFTSGNNSYPVWKNDFQVKGYIKRYLPWIPTFIYEKTINFNCSEIELQIINHPIGTQNVTAPNGTFYCYNSEGNLELQKRDVVFLDIKPATAIYPGNYTLNAGMFYLTDTYGPIVTILNKSYFNKYFRDGSNVVFNANITDGSEIEFIRSIMFDSEEIPFTNNKITTTLYEISRTLPIEVTDGDHQLKVTAEDVSGNVGFDNVSIKIDRTAPSLNLISPHNTTVLSEMVEIIVETEDLKSGINDSSVFYRLREMNNTSICPENGIGSWDCYNSDWQNLYPEGNFYIEINTTAIGILSGEYWLEIKSCDNLNNCIEL